MPEIIAVANQKGGVGKTTTTVNLAAALALAGYQTLVIDLDPQGNATSGLGFNKNEYEPNLYHVLVDLTPLEKTIKATKQAHLFLAGANIHLVGAEAELMSAIARENRLKGALESLKTPYDFILIDCPPTLGLLTINALTAAQKVLIPIQGEYYAMEGLAQLLEAIQRIQAGLNSRLQIEGGVLTLFDPRMTLSQQVHEEVKKFFKETLYQAIIPRNIRLAEAPGFGHSIFQYDPSSRGAAAYQALAWEFLDRRKLARKRIPLGSATIPSTAAVAETQIKEKVA